MSDNTATCNTDECELCHGSGIITVTRHVRGKHPDSSNEAICLTCLGTGKEI